MPDARTRRPILSPERTLGSVIQLLTPSPEYTDEHNAWVRELPQTIRQLLFTVKRYYQPEWGDNWRAHFTVDRINGFLGHELKFENQKLVSNYLRVGFDPDGSWRIYKLRPDFHPADKVAGGRRHHRFGGAAAREPERSGSRISESQREAGGELRAADFSSGPTMPFTAASTGKPRPTSQARVISFPTSSRFDVEGARALVDHVVGVRPIHRADETTASKNSWMSRKPITWSPRRTRAW